MYELEPPPAFEWMAAFLGIAISEPADTNVIDLRAALKKSLVHGSRQPKKVKARGR